MVVDTCVDEPRVIFFPIYLFGGNLISSFWTVMLWLFAKDQVQLHSELREVCVEPVIRREELDHYNSVNLVGCATKLSPFIYTEKLTSFHADFFF